MSSSCPFVQTSEVEYDVNVVNDVNHPSIDSTHIRTRRSANSPKPRPRIQEENHQDGKTQEGGAVHLGPPGGAGLPGGSPWRRSDLPAVTPRSSCHPESFSEERRSEGGEGGEIREEERLHPHPSSRPPLTVSSPCDSGIVVTTTMQDGVWPQSLGAGMTQMCRKLSGWLRCSLSH